MPDHLYRAQVNLRRQNGLPEDVISNTFHFDKDEAAAGDWASGALELSTRLAAFYTAITTLLSRAIGGTHTIKFYDMRDPLPRAPKLTTTFALSPTANSLPAEVALCLSFKATATSGVPMARRRGRVFIGPLSVTGPSTVDAEGDMRPTMVQMGLLCDAGLDLVLGGAGDARLAIYSPTTDLTSSVDDAFHDVEDLWVDNAFDTVRSRGAKALVRRTANVVG